MNTRHSLYRRFFILLIFIATPLFAAAPDRFPNLYSAIVDGQTLTLPYASNHAIDNGSNMIRRIIVVVHGAGRTPVTFTNLTAELEKRSLQDSTLVFAPQFLQEKDIDALSLPDDMLFWRGGWRQGHTSASTESHPRPARISSFQIINDVVNALAAKNVNVEHVVITGHSAGGQYVQRFAAGSMLEQDLAKSGIRVRYVPANPSSFVYFDNNRHRENESGLPRQFAPPPSSQQTDCAEYNDYKYGLTGLNTFMRGIGVEQIRKQYPTRDVRYVLGQDDDNANHRSLDKRCAALLQGRHRLERGIIFYDYLRTAFSPEIQEQHTQVILPGFAHSSKILTSSECGLRFLLDIGECSLVTPGNLVANRDGGSTTLTWIDHAENEAGYQIQRSAHNDNDFKQIADIEANSTRFVDNDLADTEGYTYRVRSYQNNQHSGHSNMAAVDAPNPVTTSAPSPESPAASSNAGSGGGAMGWFGILCLAMARLFTRDNNRMIARLYPVKK